MMPHDPPHICTDCHTPHVDNCDECFGWGLKAAQTAEGILVPVGSARSQTLDPALSIPCPMCGGTVAGAPMSEAKS